VGSSPAGWVFASVSCLRRFVASYDGSREKQCAEAKRWLCASDSISWLPLVTPRHHKDIRPNRDALQPDQAEFLRLRRLSSQSCTVGAAGTLGSACEAAYELAAHHIRLATACVCGGESISIQHPAR
jgi:hypothetical protein